MRVKSIVSWGTLVFLSILPVIFLYFFGPAKDFGNYSDFTHFLGQASGLVGMTMFAIALVLSCKFIFIESMFDGLDKVYAVHRIIGALAFILVLFHPILLVLKYVPGNIKLGATYLLPGHAAINYGVIALFGMLSLLLTTFYFKIKYNQWKFSHNFLGVFFISASIHIFLVRETVSRDNIFPGYYICALIVSTIGILAYAYVIITKKVKSNRFLYRIEKIVDKKEVFRDITLIPVYKGINHKAGQFAFLRFRNNLLSNEPHPFSIASKPGDQRIRFVIKNLGDFTGSLGVLKKGDEVEVEGPYGRFNYERTGKDKIWVAGGIGITPFLSMVQEVNLQRPSTIHLFYSVKTESDLVSVDNLYQIESENTHFKVHTWITDRQGYLKAEDIAGVVGKESIKKCELFVCGPSAFKDSIKKGLKAYGLKEHYIHDEAFNFK